MVPSPCRGRSRPGDRVERGMIAGPRAGEQGAGAFGPRFLLAGPGAGPDDGGHSPPGLPGASTVSRRHCLALLAALLLSTPLAAKEEAPRELRIVFVDTEGGAATLILTPAGESILIDCGTPGKRDAERIHAAAKKLSLRAIDHLIITHWHSDHYGGAEHLSKLIPIRKFYDRGIPETLTEDRR